MIHRQLKTDLLTACLIFKEQNYSFPYRENVTIQQLSNSNQTKRSFLLTQLDKIEDIKLFIDKISFDLKITLHYIHFSKKYSSTINGPEIFIRKTETMFWFHSNGGRVTKLPAGVNKLVGCRHRLDDILNYINGDTQIKHNECTLNIKSNLQKLEKDHNVSMEIWQKKNVGPYKFDIQRIRKSKKMGNLIQLHFDELTEKLFLITDPNLYFRGYKRKIARYDKE